MYGEVVGGIEPERFEGELAARKHRRGVSADVDLRSEALAELVESFLRIYRLEVGSQFAQDPRDQLARAIRAVFESWDAPRAKVHRRAYEIPDDLGTAVNVVQMVFGNKGAGSATGVCFSRNPSTGEAGLYGEFLLDAQGEDVVAGIRTPEPIDKLRELMPEPFAELVATIERLERHYRDMQDIEFTVDEGRLYLLQTRSAKRTAAAAVKAAVSMVAEGLIRPRGGDPSRLVGFGTRGCRLGLLWPEIYEMQVRAIVRAAKAVQKRGVEPRVEIMHPLVGFAEELRRLRELTARTVAEEGGLDYLCGKGPARSPPMRSSRPRARASKSRTDGVLTQAPYRRDRRSLSRCPAHDRSEV